MIRGVVVRNHPQQGELLTMRSSVAEDSQGFSSNLLGSGVFYAQLASRTPVLRKLKPLRGLRLLALFHNSRENINLRGGDMARERKFFGSKVDKDAADVISSVNTEIPRIGALTSSAAANGGLLLI